jgi:hypothetical protein
MVFDDDANGDSDMPPGSDPAPPPEEEDPRTEEALFDEECIPQAWVDEARDTSTWGAPASFELNGSQIEVDAQESVVESVLAPMSVSLGVESSVVAFPDAELSNGLQGTVVIAGAELAADSGELVPAATEALVLSDASATVVPVAGVDDGTRPDLGPDAYAQDVDALASAVPVEMTVDKLGITSYERAYVVTDEGTVELSGAFVVSAPRVYWPVGSTVFANAVEATFAGEVFIGLTPVAGTFSIEGEPTEALPIAILGRDAHLVVGPARVDTVEPMPVRQALDSYGALVGADMQLRRCMPETLVMWPGEKRIVELAVRERGGLTDAAFAGFTVEAEGADAWSARIELDPALPATLTTAAEAHPGASWAEALAGFVEAWVEATQAITEGIVCVFTFGFLCPDSGSSAPSEPTPLAPYPAWAEPSSIHAFEVELTAPTEPGTYAITFTATGQNYEAKIPATVIVED